MGDRAFPHQSIARVREDIHHQSKRFCCLRISMAQWSLMAVPLQIVHDVAFGLFQRLKTWWLNFWQRLFFRKVVGTSIIGPGDRDVVRLRELDEGVIAVTISASRAPHRVQIIFALVAIAAQSRNPHLTVWQPAKRPSKSSATLSRPSCEGPRIVAAAQGTPAAWPTPLSADLRHQISGS
jgi:hypothetical protein